MIRRLIVASTAASLVAGCATTIPVAEVALRAESFAPAARVPEPKHPVEIVTVAEPLPLPGQLKPLQKSQSAMKDVSSPQDRIGAANTAAKIEPARDGFINAIQVYPYTRGALYQLYAAANQVSDIALEPGERLVSVSAGDTVRWLVGDTTSGDGAGMQVHVLVKPFASGLQTNLVINTDRRTYHLELTSTGNAYMASLSWTYPASELIALKAKNALAVTTSAAVVDHGLDLDRLRFRYRISGAAPWKPVRVFDDETKVYIQFPAGIGQGEAPPLFVVGSDGKPALVNYRVRGTYYIVDRLFAAAELRLGTALQHVVRIERTDAIRRAVDP